MRARTTALVTLASLLLLATTLTAYLRHALFDADQFAGRAGAALRDPRAGRVAAQRVTDDLVLRGAPDLIAARPLILGAVDGVVRGDAFAALFRRGVLDAHRSVFDGDRDTVLLTLADVGTVAAAAVGQLRPDLAARLDRTAAAERVGLVRERLPAAVAGAARWTERARRLSWLLGALTLIAAVAAVASARDRRLAAARLAVGVAAAGLAIVAGLALGRALALGALSEPDTRAVGGALWDAFLTDLRTTGWVLVVTGAVAWAAARSLIGPVDLRRRLGLLARRAGSVPASAPARLLRALVLVVIGVALIAEPRAALEVVGVLAGAVCLALGVEAALSVVAAGPPVAPGSRARRPRARRVTVAVIAVLAAAAGAVAFLGGGGVDAPAVGAVTRCNGHAELCDRPLDEIVVPATHNSMSAPLPGWLSAEQERSIGGQLEDGIRGLLIDTHYGDRLANGRVRTVLGDRVAQGEDGVSAEQAAAAERLRGRIGFRGKGVRGMYLCHSFCELGATPLADGLREIHDFLVTHPGEVVFIVNQDYVTPADFVRAMDDAGLARYAFSDLDARRWPTVGEAIARGQRLVVLAENHAGAAPWYQLAYRRLTVETPYSFARAALLTDPAHLAASCAANRGPARAPLFLINHWVTTAPIQRPSDAAKVNARGPLLRRARTCARLRDHRPTLLAVNFYKRGDLFGVVDELNAVRRP